MDLKPKKNVAMPVCQPITHSMSEFFSSISSWIEVLGWEGQAVIRLAVAAILGGLIGAEREHHGRSPGFRTQLLVALGSSLTMIVSIYFAEIYGDESASTVLRVDPGRVAYGVMVGIGFLGAGAIMRYGAGIRGLTTAASLWCTAAVGLACGLGMFIIAGAATAMVLFTLLVLAWLEGVLLSRTSKTVVVKIGAGVDQISRTTEAIKKRGAKIVDEQYNFNITDKVQTLTFIVSLPSNKGLRRLLSLQDDLPDAMRIEVR